MTRTLALAAVLALSPAHAAADGVPRDPEAWPAHVRVFRRHARGGSAPARIEVVGFRTYVARVLASGAMPADRPMAALRAMAVVVATRAAWLVRHPDPGCGGTGDASTSRTAPGPAGAAPATTGCSTAPCGPTAASGAPWPMCWARCWCARTAP